MNKKSEMNNEASCPTCGSPLPEGRAQGLCPTCLMAQAMASRTLDPQGETEPTAPPVEGYMPIPTPASTPAMKSVYPGTTQINTGINAQIAIRVPADARVFGEPSGLELGRRG